MFFALRDYLHYRHQSGRFTRHYKKSLMGAAFQRTLPANARRLLRPGDVLFIQTLDSFLAWLVMYLTKSEISHVVFYVGNDQIAHATLSGVVFEPVEALYRSNTRILPCIWPMADDKRQL